MFDFSLFYLEFDPTIGPKIERVQSSQTSLNSEINSNLKKTSSLLARTNFADFINSDPVRMSRIGSKKIGNVTDKMLSTVLKNSFPESIKQLSHSKPYFFTFTFNQDQLATNMNDNYFCYSIYMSVPDKKMKRKYHQFSYVIVTKMMSPVIFKELFMSTFNSFRFSYQQQENESFENEISRCTYEIFDVLFSFLKQWQEIISTSLQNFKGNLEKIDLPLIDGSIKAKMSKKINSKRIEVCDILKKDTTSIFDALNFDKIKILDQLLFQNNNKFDNDYSLYNETLKIIWESIVFNKNILVLGATPDEASDAVFALNLLVKDIRSYIIPYISVTDERFMQLIKRPRVQNRFPVIVGVSNPISEFFVDSMKNGNKSFFDFVYYVGFDDKVGFKELVSEAKLCQSLDSNSHRINFLENSVMMKKFDVYTAIFLKVIDESLTEMSKSDFSSLFIGQINITLLANTFLENKIKISNYFKKQIESSIRAKQQNKKILDVFSEQFINTQLFMNERKHFFYFSEASQKSLVDEKVVNKMICMINNKDILRKNENENENEKIESDFCSSCSEDNEMESKNVYDNNPMAKKVFNVYIHALKNSINDDLKKKLRRALKDITQYTNHVIH